jgi:hypothetical protein
MYQVTGEELQKIIAEVVSKRVFWPNVSPDMIIMKPAPGYGFQFHLRLSKNYEILPPSEVSIRIYEQTGKKAKGVWWVIHGGLMIIDPRIRAHLRIVSIETFEIKRVAMGNADLSRDGIIKAFEEAFLQLGIGMVADSS